jgi:ACS family D-galactonate transporter-like MFS transporter
MTNKAIVNGQAASAYRWVILATGILAYGTSQFSRQNFAGVQKFIAADLHMDKSAVGLLASAFFYTYALFQIPWGVASDRFGSRWIIGLGILLTSATMLGFSTGQSEGSLLFWRACAGVAAAAVYVPLTGGIARWFPDKERSLSQATLGGVGGALGEGMAFFLLPVLSVYFVSGWRQGMVFIAAAIAVMGAISIAAFRSAPAGQRATTAKPFDRGLLKDPQLWCYALLYSAFVIGIRETQTWMAVYAADVYIGKYGVALNQAVVQGGLLALVAYSLVGRVVGCPLAGQMSDVLARRGVSRTAVLIGWLVAGIALLAVLMSGTPTILSLGILMALLGTSVNLFSLVPAAISETYGSQRTASVSSFANTMAQFSGATALAASGYVGVSLTATPGNALTDYRGIWLSAMVGMILMTVLGVICFVVANAGRRQMSAASSPSVA